jgi:hypothetical protein
VLSKKKWSMCVCGAVIFKVCLICQKNKKLNKMTELDFFNFKIVPKLDKLRVKWLNKNWNFCPRLHHETTFCSVHLKFDLSCTIMSNTYTLQIKLTNSYIKEYINLKKLNYIKKNYIAIKTPHNKKFNFSVYLIEKESE